MQYTEEYENSLKKLDYIGMNSAAKRAAELRMLKYPEHDKYVDNYDYTYGGMYDIYTNGDEDYYGIGYYEEVYVLDSYSLASVGNKTQSTYEDDNKKIKSPFENTVTSILSLLNPLNYRNPGKAYYSVVKIGSKYVYNDIKYDELMAVVETNDYINRVTSGKYSDNFTYYMYILYGNYSSEIKIRAVYGENNTEYFHMSFDLKQDEAATIFSSYANEYGTMVALNRRTHNYSYTHN